MFNQVVIGLPLISLRNLDVHKRLKVFTSMQLNTHATIDQGSPRKEASNICCLKNGAGRNHPIVNHRPFLRPTIVTEQAKL